MTIRIPNKSIPSRTLPLLAVTLGLFAFCKPAKADLTHTFTSGTDVAVTGPNYFVSGALNLSLAFAPTPGTNLTVVKNTGTAFISGTFNGVPQGSTVPLIYNGVTYNYIANYYGEYGRSLILQWPCLGLAAWGTGVSGQMGNGTYNSSNVPVEVTTNGALAGKAVIAIAGNYDHCLTLTSDGQVFAWGANNVGQLGNNGTTRSNVPTPIYTGGVLAGKRIIAIAGGYDQSLALSSDGQVFAWGGNAEGQLGNSGTTNSLVPVLVYSSGVLAGKTAVGIAACPIYSMVITSDGNVYGWGDGSYGQLGNNSTSRNLVPVGAYGSLFGKVVLSIKGGCYHSLALTSDGQVYAAGANWYGQLGNSGTTRSLVPVPVSTDGALAGKNIVGIDAAYEHNLAISSDGRIFTWGHNDYGQLGNNTLTDSLAPIDISGNLSGKVRAVAGSNGAFVQNGSHSMASTTDGQVSAWGYNGYGQLGNNSTTDSDLPVMVNTQGVLAGKTVTSVVAGRNRCLAMFTAGPPSVNSNPANQIATLGTNVGFSVVAVAGTPSPSIQWQMSTSGTGGVFSSVDTVANPTASTGTLVLNNVTLTQNGYAYRAVFSNPVGSTTTTPAVLTVQRTFGWFQNQYGLSTSNPLADPNHIGVCNLAAYAFGLNPSAPDRTKLPCSSVQNGYLQITFPQWTNAADLTYVVEVSSDLQTWSSGPTYTLQVSATPDLTDATRQWVTVRDLLPMASSPHRFIRVRLIH